MLSAAKLKDRRFIPIDSSCGFHEAQGHAWINGFIKDEDGRAGFVCVKCGLEVGYQPEYSLPHSQEKRYIQFPHYSFSRSRNTFGTPWNPKVIWRQNTEAGITLKPQLENFTPCFTPCVKKREVIPYSVHKKLEGFARRAEKSWAREDSWAHVDLRLHVRSLHTQQGAVIYQVIPYIKNQALALKGLKNLSVLVQVLGLDGKELFYGLTSNEAPAEFELSGSQTSTYKLFLYGATFTDGYKVGDPEFWEKHKALWGNGDGFLGKRGIDVDIAPTANGHVVLYRDDRAREWRKEGSGKIVRAVYRSSR